MKKTIALVLVCALLLGGCSQREVASKVPINTPQVIEQTVKQEVIEEVTENSQVVNVAQDEQENNIEYLQKMDFKGLDDQDLHQYVEDSLYNDLVARIDSEAYFIENIETTYISKEYIDELTYNSQANIYFGYTLEELDEAFQGERYIFTLGKEGETIAVPFEAYDNTYEEVIKNVAIGSGVILICVTVSAVSAGVGAPAVSVIFAASAKTATTFAASSAGLGAVTEGILTGIQMGDMDEAIEAAVFAGSEGFKWGAITGAVTGGANQYVKLKGATIKGLTLNEAAMVQKESAYPIDVIKQIHSKDAYNVFKDANLKNELINGKNALIRTDIDLNLKDEFGRTNLERMKKGLSAIDKNGKSHELHHIGQEMDSPLAILTYNEHRSNSGILHGLKESSEINRAEFEKEKKEFWKAVVEILDKGEL